jgi:hypothetical protein
LELLFFSFLFILLTSFTVIVMMPLAEEQMGLLCFYLHGIFDVIP